MGAVRWRRTLGADAGAGILLASLLLIAMAGCGGSPSSSAVGTEESQPVLSIEVPTESSLLLPFRIAGWAIDRGSASGPGVDRIEVRDGGCDGELLGTADDGIERPDVVSSFGERFAEAGWQFVVEDLSVGEHLIAVELYSTLTPEPLCNVLTILVL